MEKKAKRQRLEKWQQRLALSNQHWDPEVSKMDHRERLLDGSRELRPLVQGQQGATMETPHVRNIIFENIETQVSTNIPSPKVTPVRKEDEHLAELIERFLRNEMDRLPFEVLNDMAERTVPAQGGVLFWGEWDHKIRTHDTVGAMSISVLHPKQIAPQPGVYTDLTDMDWFILKIPTTRAYVRRMYGVDLPDEGESEPELRSVESQDSITDALTLYIGYERNDEGKINKFCWVNDTTLEDLEDYQARRQPVCTGCGRPKPLRGQMIYRLPVVPEVKPDLNGIAAGLTMAQQLADGYMAGMEGPGVHIADSGTDRPGGRSLQAEEYKGGACPWCGCAVFESKQMEYEEVVTSIKTSAGTEIPGGTFGFDEQGLPAVAPTKIPFYKPDVYPVVLQRSVSKFGQLLGTSDVDVIEDQQNTLNHLNKKILERVMEAGSLVTLPADARIETSPKDGRVVRVKDQAQKGLIDVHTFTGSLEYELACRNFVYQESREELGITDSFQGRKDPTATSGKAKEYAAAMAAGRLESKRVMKNAAYARLYELMFKSWLAYADEPRPVYYRDSEGETVYEEISRYDFLAKDSDGQYYWNDMFLFSVDSNAPLERNREAMWQETRMNLQTGAFGNPSDIETLILFWTKMEEQHYPGAASTKKHLKERQRLRQEAMRLQALQTPQTAALTDGPSGGRSLQGEPGGMGSLSMPGQAGVPAMGGFQNLQEGG